MGSCNVFPSTLSCYQTRKERWEKWSDLLLFAHSRLSISFAEKLNIFIESILCVWGWYLHETYNLSAVCMSNILQNNEYVSSIFYLQKRMMHVWYMEDTQKVLVKWINRLNIFCSSIFTPYFASQQSWELPFFLRKWQSKISAKARQRTSLGSCNPYSDTPSYLFCIFSLPGILSYLVYVNSPYYLTICLIISFSQMCIHFSYLDFKSMVLRAKTFAQEAFSSRSTFIHLYVTKTNLLYRHLRLMDGK